MTPTVAEAVHQFLSNNPIHSANIMGGEFWLNPNWEAILATLVDGLDYARIVTNGDWVADPAVAEALRAFMDDRDHCFLAITNDRWHNGVNTEAAITFCKQNVMLHHAGGDEDDKGIVPVGRSAFSMDGFYGMFACYCQKPDHKYQFLIDEDGKIFKCPFGTWDYDSIFHFLSGGFCERFKEFNEKFYETFIGSCSRCRRAYCHAMKQSEFADII